MSSEVFRARYTDEHVIMRELKTLFPSGSIRITFERSRFFCTVPQTLTEGQRQTVLNAIEADHYARDT